MTPPAADHQSRSPEGEHGPYGPRRHRRGQAERHAVAAGLGTGLRMRWVRVVLDESGNTAVGAAGPMRPSRVRLPGCRITDIRVPLGTEPEGIETARQFTPLAPPTRHRRPVANPTRPTPPE